ncbi:DNA-binding NarL/FixJ family response regulator [Serratia fonticola]|jgi:DNA-binding NarL/FixJ family response regulator|uniref:DNA-binding NarL/FixJ family response regulator n=1 Tax=Serratia fonticola TaxID=47917 RepID=A0A559T7B0_SERFO|nr:LuxR C-terminal-related transcriptional regulator [Serratia fonticola]TQI81982.1 DNA-binding NarL/FixJ family response regulator [Serratia fonticola]TQI95995.1 DNA-binding NarL/FixJ family response regulator [Serratia fonticola]TVZ70492.1 DNA-binding NarL/FixJ family response regulator [Serratia fonticola]
MTLCNLPITRVALLTPSQLIEQGIERLLEEQADFRLVWRMGSISEARLRLIAPHVEMLIVTISTHQAGWQRWLQFIRVLRRTCPEMKIVVIMDISIPYFLQQLAEIKIDGILSQCDRLDEIRTAFTLVSQGGVYRSSRIGGTLSDEPGAMKPTALSLMELRVLQSLVQGVSIKHTAELLMRSEKTIMATKGKAMHKLGIKHSADLVAMRDVLEYLYLELTQSGESHVVTEANDVQKHIHRASKEKEIETLPTWLPPVDLLHSRGVMSGSYPARKE